METKLLNSILKNIDNSESKIETFRLFFNSLSNFDLKTLGKLCEGLEALSKTIAHRSV